MAPSRYRLTAMSEAPQLRLLRRDATEAPEASGAADAAGRRHHGRHRLVLVHGSMDRATSFTRLMARLRRLGHRRLRPARLCRLGRDRAADDLRRSGRRSARGASMASRPWPSATASAATWCWRRPPTSRSSSRPPSCGSHPNPGCPGGPTATGRRSGSRNWSRTSGPSRFMRRMVGDRVWERLPSSTRAQRRAGKATRSKPRSTAWPWRPSSTPPRYRSP